MFKDGIYHNEERAAQKAAGTAPDNMAALSSAILAPAPAKKVLP
jgi:hypothetical protein